MIWIRADANSEIGSGHIMRCLSVAAELKKAGHQVCFCLADEFAVSLLEDRDMPYRVLGSRYDNPAEELPLLCSWLEEEKPAVLLTDSYFITPEYITCVNQYVKTACFDDCMKEAFPADVVINYNIYGDELPYREQALRKDTTFLLGTAYAPLREEFQDKEAPLRDEVRNVLVTTGGSDKYNLAGRIVEKALAGKETKGLHYHIVSGAFNIHGDSLKALAAEHENVVLHQNVKEMAALMQRCDIALTAGGSTLYELCAVGVPMICFSFAENQRMQVETFAKRGLALYAGDYDLLGEKVIAESMSQLGLLINDTKLRAELRTKIRRCADGHGAGRIAEILGRIK